MRGLVKTSVGLVLEVKRAAHEAGEGLQDLAAEVTAEVVAAQLASGAATAGPGPAPAPAKPATSDDHPKPHVKAPVKGRAPTVATGLAD